MQDFAVIAVAYGGYISLIKFIPFLVLFFLWWPLIGWVYEDTEHVETNRPLWTGVVLGAGAVAALFWLLVPIYLVGMFLYLIAVITSALVYVKHRNARVMDFDRVLTADHIKSLFARSADAGAEMRNTVFITANKNEVELP